MGMENGFFGFRRQTPCFCLALNRWRLELGQPGINVVVSSAYRQPYPAALSVLSSFRRRWWETLLVAV